MLIWGAIDSTISRAPLVLRIHVGMHEADGHALETAPHQHVGKGPDSRLVERHQLPARSGDPARGHEAMVTRDERRRQHDVEVVLLESIFRAHLDDIAKAERCEEGGLGALALDQRVRGQRRSVDDEIDVGDLNTGVADDSLNAIENRLLRGGVGGEHLHRVQSPPHFHGHVRKGAADIDPESYLPSPDHGRRPLEFASQKYDV